MLALSSQSSKYYYKENCFSFTASLNADPGLSCIKILFTLACILRIATK